MMSMKNAIFLYGCQKDSINKTHYVVRETRSTNAIDQVPHAVEGDEVGLLSGVDGVPEDVPRRVLADDGLEVAQDRRLHQPRPAAPAHRLRETCRESAAAVRPMGFLAVGPMAGGLQGMDSPNLDGDVTMSRTGL